MRKVTPFLMFNDQLEAAIEFYTSTFPDSRVTKVARAGKDGPVNSAEFVIGGQSFMGYNGGSYFTFSEGVSLSEWSFAKTKRATAATASAYRAVRRSPRR
jgi:predicted 3-demethylubiquinone-9 3-methyltransferase (glyoxalase superfamily)